METCGRLALTWIVLVHGPYLVRSASWDQATRTLDIQGDLDAATTLTVFAPASLCTLKWNGDKVKIDSREGNKFSASLEGPQAFELPALGSWRYTDSLPEISADYEPTSAVWVGKSTKSCQSLETIS